MLTEKERPKVVVLMEKDRTLRELMMRCLAEAHHTVFAEEKRDRSPLAFQTLPRSD